MEIDELRDTLTVRDVAIAERAAMPWSGTGRGDVAKLNPELRAALAEARYVLVHCPEAVFNPET